MADSYERRAEVQCEKTRSIVADDKEDQTNPVLALLMEMIRHRNKITMVNSISP
jgi:hypothetical protein